MMEAEAGAPTADDDLHGACHAPAAGQGGALEAEQHQFGSVDDAGEAALPKGADTDAAGAAALPPADAPMDLDGTPALPPAPDGFAPPPPNGATPAPADAAPGEPRKRRHVWGPPAKGEYPTLEELQAQKKKKKRSRWESVEDDQSLALVPVKGGSSALIIPGQMPKEVEVAGMKVRALACACACVRVCGCVGWRTSCPGPAGARVCSGSAVAQASSPQGWLSAGGPRRAAGRRHPPGRAPPIRVWVHGTVQALICTCRPRLQPQLPPLSAINPALRAPARHRALKTRTDTRLHHAAADRRSCLLASQAAWGAARGTPTWRRCTSSWPRSRTSWPWATWTYPRVRGAMVVISGGVAG